MKQPFSIRRIGNIIYRDLVLLKSTIITTSLVVGIIFFLGFLYSLRKDHSVTSDELTWIFSLIYVLLGLLLTFAIFKEVHNQKLNHFYFSLPVSPLERLMATWLTSSVIYTVVISIYAFLIGQLAILIGSLFSASSVHLAPLFSDDYWRVVKVYFLIQPTFLFGSIAFTKNRMGKTLLAVLLVFMAVLIFNVILCFSFYGGAFDVFESEQLSSDAFYTTKDYYARISKWLFAIILGPLMLLASYFKITEKEV